MNIIKNVDKLFMNYYYDGIGMYIIPKKKNQLPVNN